jgi:RNase P subunit RPR2
MPDPTRLQAGDTYPCPRCRQPHVVEQPYRDRTTAERSHLYVTCRGAHYFVGVAARVDVESDH